MGMGVLTQGSPQQPPETHVFEPAAPCLGGQGVDPPQQPGSSVPHKTEPDPCPRHWIQ